MRPTIAVIGPDPCSPAEAAFAHSVGREIGTKDYVLICGGLGGVMEAACEGANDAGGLTVGFLPGADRRSANKFVDVALPTGMGELRNGLIVRAAQVIVAVGGGWGTLSEIALAVKAKKVVIAWDSWKLERRAVDTSIIAVASMDEVVREIGNALSARTSSAS